jgi:hypothetical protein
MPCTRELEVDGKCGGTRRVDCRQYIDFETDESHCGGCGQECAAGEHATAVCQSGVCGLQCDDGFVDRDGDPTNGCECATSETCGDGEDNDCDGVVDENCQCNFQGNMQGVCTGQGTGAGGNCRTPSNFEPTETSCGDGLDNDCDGNVDCADEDCSNRPCRGRGTTCLSGDATCHETNCRDGVDNDNDGKADCRDADCTGRVCDTGNGVTCPPPGSFEGGMESSCGDGLDNDCDGLVDCEDPDCTTDNTCGTGTGAVCLAEVCIETNCGDDTDNNRDFRTDVCHDGAGCLDGTCSERQCGDGIDNDGDGDVDECAAGSVCDGEVCRERNCGDGIDNDLDGSVDECDSGATCIDGTCRETTCGDGQDNDYDGESDECDMGASCQGGTCVEDNCSDGVDNDYDGKVDCADSDCTVADACGTGSGAACLAAQCIESNCSDGVDNDGDGNVDQCGGGAGCFDGTCTENNCGDGTDNDVDGSVDECAADSVCRSGTCRETNCGDGLDADGDGTVDECDSGATCSSGTCTESACGNGQDDDYDGLSDCTDPDCSCSVQGALTQSDPGRWSNGTYADSCQAYQYPAQSGSATEDGWYDIKPPGVSSALTVYCDLTTSVDGKQGGWTAVTNDVASKFGHSLRAASRNSDCSYFGNDSQPGIDDKKTAAGVVDDHCRYEVDLGFDIDTIRLDGVVIESTAASGADSDLGPVREPWSNAWGPTCDNRGDVWFGVPAANGPTLRAGLLETNLGRCYSSGSKAFDAGETFTLNASSQTSLDQTLRIDFGEDGGQKEGWMWKDGRIFVRDSSSIP